MHGFEVVLDEPIEAAEELVRRELAAEGFGVLADINIAGTLAAKLGVTRHALRILGACNPGLANRALDVDPSASLLLPCNVVLEATATGTRVEAVDPTALLTTEALRPIADDAAERLRRVIGRVGEHAVAA